jgi:hypothetical protein
MPPRKRLQSSQSLISKSFKATRVSSQSASHAKTETTAIDSQFPPEELERIHKVLKAFDLDMDYGPMLGIMRTARLKRALALGFPVSDQVCQVLENRRLLGLHPELNLNIWHDMDSLI